MDEGISKTSRAVKILVIANITMSLDNMPAVAGAAQGNFSLLFIGLGVSIPVVFFASYLLCLVIERYPILNYVGCAVIAQVGADMIPSDPFVVNALAPSRVFSFSAQIISIPVVFASGHFYMKIAGSELKE